MNYTTFQLLSIAQALLGDFSLLIRRGQKVIFRNKDGDVTALYTLIDETQSAFIVKTEKGPIVTFSKSQYEAEVALYAE